MIMISVWFSNTFNAQNCLSEVTMGLFPFLWPGFEPWDDKRGLQTVLRKAKQQNDLRKAKLAQWFPLQHRERKGQPLPITSRQVSHKVSQMLRQSRQLYCQKDKRIALLPIWYVWHNKLSTPPGNKNGLLPIRNVWHNNFWLHIGIKGVTMSH